MNTFSPHTWCFNFRKRALGLHSIEFSLIGVYCLQQESSDAVSGIRRNAKGGIYVNPQELKAAFEFFDVDGKGHITMNDLKKRLGVFYQSLSLREYKFLMNNKVLLFRKNECIYARLDIHRHELTLILTHSQQELTESDLYQLLAHNELTNYDPVAEAFKIYDPNETGYIDIDVFR